MTVDLVPYVTPSVPAGWVEPCTLAEDLALLDDPDAQWALLVERFLLGYRSPQTQRAYRADLLAWRAFTGALGTDPLHAGRGHVDAWVTALSTDRTSATVARKVSTLAAFYGWLVDEEVLARSPVRGRRPRATDEPTSTGLTEREAGRLLDAAEADGPRSYVLVSLLYLLGLRVSEALTARVEDRGWERGFRTVVVTRKGGGRSRLPLPPDLADAVDRLVRDRADGTIIATATGRAMDAKAAWKTLRRLGREADLPQAATLHPHDLRHAFATASLDAGSPLRDVQDAMGHADPRTTRRYDRSRSRLDRHPSSTLASRVAVHRQGTIE